MATKTYVEKTEALIKGNNAKEIGTKNQKRVSAEIAAQIAQKAAKRLKLEQTLETAEENLQTALVRDSLIEDSGSVVQSFLDAKEEVEQAQAQLDHHDKEVKWLGEAKELLK